MTYIRLAKDKMQVMCSGITGYTRPQNDCSIIQSIYICSKYSFSCSKKQVETIM